MSLRAHRTILLLGAALVMLLAGVALIRLGRWHGTKAAGTAVLPSHELPPVAAVEPPEKGNSAAPVKRPTDDSKKQPPAPPEPTPVQTPVQQQQQQPAPPPQQQQQPAPPPQQQHLPSDPVQGQQQQQPPPLAVPQFPWPPPAASAAQVVPATLLQKNGRFERLGAVDTVLSAALDRNGYSERSYFGVPQGFAMITRLEQIGPDGSPLNPPARWSANPPRLVDGFTISRYLRSLFTAEPGFYRVIVFVVTDVPFTQSDRSINTIEAEEWLRSGLNFLPSWIGTQIYTSQVVCTALIYEFERQANRDPSVVLPSRFDARTHLVRSGLWRAMEGS